MLANDEGVLDHIDWERMNRIAKFQCMNSEVIRRYAAYLLHESKFITKELVDGLIHDCSVSQEYAFYVLVAAVCGLNIDGSKKDWEIANEYILPSIKCLDTSHYEENEYYRNIKIPEVKFHNWELKYESYQPYEGFIYNDLKVTKDFKEIPQLGFFKKEFHFPAVLESGVEWMTITPNEIETMQPVIDLVRGNVVTFGLGLGYFTYMVSMKQEVEKVTVVERDTTVIELFSTYILPQFQYKEKIEIIHMDAFEFAKEHLKIKNYSYAFVDLWHDAADGSSLYFRMKQYERLNPGTVFTYWIEYSFLSQLRSYSFLAILRLKNKTLANYPINIQEDSIDQAQFEQRIEVMMKNIIEEESRGEKPVEYYLNDGFLQTIGEKMAEIRL